MVVKVELHYGPFKTVSRRPVIDVNTRLKVENFCYLPNKKEEC